MSTCKQTTFARNVGNSKTVVLYFTRKNGTFDTDGKPYRSVRNSESDQNVQI